MTRRHAAAIAAFSAALTVPQGVMAHPHVFIDAALSLGYADGALTEIAVEWSYDEFYSLLIIEDMGLDPDGDGILTEAETAAIQGFDGDWEEGFDGRLFLRAGDLPVAMEDPRDFTARYEDGRLTSRHRRILRDPVPFAQDLKIQVYDPEYYVQFTLLDDPRITGATCETRLTPGDPYAAADAYAAAVAAALEEDATADAEVVAVDIGATGADEMRVTCAAAP